MFRRCSLGSGTTVPTLELKQQSLPPPPQPPRKTSGLRWLLPGHLLVGFFCHSKDVGVHVTHVLAAVGIDDILSIDWQLLIRINGNKHNTCKQAAQSDSGARGPPVPAKEDPCSHPPTLQDEWVTEWVLTNHSTKSRRICVFTRRWLAELYKTLSCGIQLRCDMIL